MLTTETFTSRPIRNIQSSLVIRTRTRFTEKKVVLEFPE